MKKFIYNNPLLISILGLTILATIAWATEWQDYGTYSAEPATGDTLLLNDISNSPPGTLTQLSWTNLQTYLANGAGYWVSSSQAYLPSEIVVNNEATLYNALSDVDDFVQMNETNPEFGVNDTTQGHLELFGNNSTGGGKSTWYSGTTGQSDEDYWSCQAVGAEFQCGPASDIDMFIFDNNAVINPSDSPNFTGHHDTDDENVNYFGMESGTKAATEADTILQGFTGNALTTFLQHDGGDDEVLSSKAFRISNAVDGGMEQLELSADYNIESLEPNVCRKRYVMTTASNANVEFELPSSNTCATGVTKELHFHNGEKDNYDLIIDPNGTDQIILNVEDECGAGNPIYCGEEYSEVTLYRRTDTAWNAIVIPGVGTCACSSQQ